MRKEILLPICTIEIYNVKINFPFLVHSQKTYTLAQTIVHDFAIIPFVILSRYN